MHTSGNTPRAEFGGKTTNQTIQLAVATTLIEMDQLPLESRFDLIEAAMNYYLTAMLGDFIEMVTTERGGRPFGLLRRTDDKAKEEVWAAAMQAAQEVKSRMIPVHDRFFNLRELLKENK